MKKGFLPAILFASFLSLAALEGCKKESSIGIDNDKVVKTPYSLYVADNNGWLLNSTDGERYSGIFPPDGYPPSLIVTSGDNLLVLKENLHMSTNNGKNFNPVYTNVKKFPWQTMAYNSYQQNILYITSKTAARGVAMSKDNGKTWQDDLGWDDNVPPGFEISSFSGLANGHVFAYSNLNNVMFKRDNNSDNWTPVTMETLLPVDGTQYYLSANSNTLFLTDYNGPGGVFYSQDEGLHWKPYGLVRAMISHHLNCAASPNGGNSFLVGVDTGGVYRVQDGNFTSSTTGLEKNTSVYSMAVKSNTYKNNVTRSYVFIATNKGIYRSEDNGYTWDKMTFGEFDGIYKAAY